VRIFKTYGSDAIQVMSENPYRLARDIRGIGFKTADAIAMKLGIEKTALIRVRAGISYALTEAMDEGHCGLPTDELLPLAEKLLEVPQQLIRTALELELKDGTVIADRVGETPCIFLAGLYRAGRRSRDVLPKINSNGRRVSVHWFTGVLQSLCSPSQVARMTLGEQRRKGPWATRAPRSRHRDRPRQFVRIAVADWL
jgi:hypothetical protein